MIAHRSTFALSLVVILAHLSRFLVIVLSNLIQFFTVACHVTPLKMKPFYMILINKISRNNQNIGGSESNLKKFWYCALSQMNDSSIFLQSIWLKFTFLIPKTKGHNMTETNVSYLSLECVKWIFIQLFNLPLKYTVSTVQMTDS